MSLTPMKYYTISKLKIGIIPSTKIFSIDKNNTLTSGSFNLLFLHIEYTILPTIK